MTISIRPLVLSLAFASASAAAIPSSGASVPPAAPDGGSVWPVPAGWKKETIPFPLEFAPDLAHTGVEELRFLPGFSRPQSPDYWSYDFVWRLRDESAVDEKSLADELTRYFRGLDMAVAGEKYGFDPKRFKADVSALPEKGRYRARVESYDPFATGKPIVLNVEIERKACPGGRRVVTFAISPQPAGASVWNALRLETAAVRCG